MRDDSRDLYLTNPTFRAIADMTTQCMRDGSLTSDEIRRAVMVGAERFHLTHMPPIFIPHDQFNTSDWFCEYCGNHVGQMEPCMNKAGHSYRFRPEMGLKR